MSTFSLSGDRISSHIMPCSADDDTVKPQFKLWSPETWKAEALINMAYRSAHNTAPLRSKHNGHLVTALGKPVLTVAARKFLNSFNCFIWIPYLTWTHKCRRRVAVTVCLYCLYNLSQYNIWYNFHDTLEKYMTHFPYRLQMYKCTFLSSYHLNICILNAIVSPTFTLYFWKISFHLIFISFLL